MKIFAALHDDVSQGLIWLRSTGLPPRCVVKVTAASGHAVYCEALQIEVNFLNTYNRRPRLTIKDSDAAIVLSEWFRTKLGGLETQREYELRIEVANGACGKVHACLDHPQIIVRVAAWLGIASVALGCLGVILGLLSIGLSVRP